MKKVNSEKKGVNLKVLGISVFIIILLIFGLINSRFGRKSEKPPAVSSSPKQVVEGYLKTTLGTIPGSKVDYNKAKDYLTDNLKKQFTDSSFVPLTYGIQDGPTEVKIVSENITTPTSSVQVEGFWDGKVGRRWEFELMTEQNQWKINAIKRL